MNYPLHSNDALTQIAKSNGIMSWNELTNFVQNLPYGRNSNRFDFGLVITEQKGSCSSKHALLQKIADLNEIPDIQLILGIYKMNTSNTPKIGSELSKHRIDYIPEAHCYLKIRGSRVDFTSDDSSFGKIERDILLEIEIKPEQVVQYKVDYHKDYLDKWLADSSYTFEFDQIWQIREKCISNLSK